MKTYFISQIEWVSFENGGRRVIPPKGTRYCPLILLDDEEGKKWSIDFVCPDFSETDLIEFSFLVDGAPTEKIIPQRTYDLYEERKMFSIVNQLKNAQKETGIYLDDISSEQFDNIKLKILLNLKIKINDTSNFIWQDFPQNINICGEYAWKHIPKILDEYKFYILFFNQIECKKAYGFYDANNLCTIIGETYDFEFYITDLEGSFILCFNHEEILCGCGNVTNKMREYRTSIT